MNVTQTILLAGLCAVLISLTATLRADEPTNCPAGTQRNGHIQDRKGRKSESMTPEQFEAKMKEWRLKLELGLKDLRTKRENGTITEEERKKLERMELMLKRIDEKLAARKSGAKPESSEPKNSDLNKKENQTYENKQK